METVSNDVADFLDAQVHAFSKLRPTYEVMSRLLFRILTQAKKDLDVSGVVQTRTKDLASFAEKAIRKRSLYVDPVHSMNDLCGGRIMTVCRDDIEPVCEVLQKRLKVVEGEDTVERLAAAEFGYRAVHFVVSFDRAQLENLLSQLGDDEFRHLIAGFEHKTLRISSKQSRAQLCDILCQCEDGSATATASREFSHPKVLARPKFRAEIQVRSSLQHAWAEFSHDRFYKSGFRIPRRWQRMISRIAATLEAADDDFARTTSSLDEYRTYYGAYMSMSDRRKELANLKAIWQYDKDNVRLAGRVSRIAISLGGFKTANTILAPFVAKWETSPAGDTFKKLWNANARYSDDLDMLDKIQAELQACRDQQFSEILTDYGWSKWKLGDHRRRNYLEWAVALNPKNISARLFLAETYVDKHDEVDALECYSQAFKLTPTDPDVLAGLLFCKLCAERSTNSLSTLRTSLDMAIEHCWQRIRANIDLPHAFYKMGLFFLLLGKPYQGLNAYAKAVVLSESDADIEHQHSRITSLCQALKDGVPELEWVREFLMAARTAKLLDEKGQLTRQSEQIRQEIKDMGELGQQDPDTEASQQWQAEVSQLESALAEAKQRLAVVSKKATKLLRDCRTVLREHGRAKPPALLKDRFLTTLQTDPIVIIAGGCDQKYQDRIQSYRAIFEMAFQKFRGIIFSGCTDAGVSKLVGDLHFPPDSSARRIAYVPRSIPSWLHKHKAFTEVVMTDAERFSALDPIMNWIHILASGRDPSKVKMLGINGGQIAAFEFRMALAMGAEVGILSHSGRAATDIFADAIWKQTPGLLRLPTDPHTLRLFVCGFAPCEKLAQHREELAMSTHERYRENQFKGLVKREANLRPWNELPLPLKESNRQQIDFIEDALRAIGLTMKYVGVENMDQIALYKFKQDEENRLAELEHARWNVERLLAGWKLGPKDVDNKTTPYLVAWSELPEDIKKYDYDPVRAIPEKLRRAGYEIVDLKER